MDKYTSFIKSMVKFYNTSNLDIYKKLDIINSEISTFNNDNDSDVSLYHVAKEIGIDKEEIVGYELFNEFR